MVHYSPALSMGLVPKHLILTLGYKLYTFTQAHRFPEGGETFHLWVGFHEDWNSTEGVCCLSFFGVLKVGPSCRAAGIKVPELFLSRNPLLWPQLFNEVRLEFRFIGVDKAEDILPPTEFWVTKFLWLKNALHDPVTKFIYWNGAFILCFSFIRV